MAATSGGADRVGLHLGPHLSLTKLRAAKVSPLCNFLRGLLPVFLLLLVHAPPAPPPQRHCHILPRMLVHASLHAFDRLFCVTGIWDEHFKEEMLRQQQFVRPDVQVQCTPPPHCPPLRALRTRKPGALVAPG